MCHARGLAPQLCVILLQKLKGKNEMKLDEGPSAMVYDDALKLWLPRDPKEREEFLKAQPGPPPPPPGAAAIMSRTIATPTDGPTRLAPASMNIGPSGHDDGGGRGAVDSPNVGATTAREGRGTARRPAVPAATASSPSLLVDPLAAVSTLGSAGRAGARGRREKLWVPTGLSGSATTGGSASGAGAPGGAPTLLLPPMMPRGGYAGSVMQVRPPTMETEPEQPQE